MEHWVGDAVHMLQCVRSADPHTQATAGLCAHSVSMAALLSAPALVVSSAVC